MTSILLKFYCFCAIKYTKLTRQCLRTRIYPLMLWLLMDSYFCYWRCLLVEVVNVSFDSSMPIDRSSSQSEAIWLCSRSILNVQPPYSVIQPSWRGSPSSGRERMLPNIFNEELAIESKLVPHKCSHWNLSFLCWGVSTLSLNWQKPGGSMSMPI